VHGGAGDVNRGLHDLAQCSRRGTNDCHTFASASIGGEQRGKGGGGFGRDEALKVNDVVIAIALAAHLGSWHCERSEAEGQNDHRLRHQACGHIRKEPVSKVATGRVAVGLSMRSIAVKAAACVCLTARAEML